MGKDAMGSGRRCFCLALSALAWLGVCVAGRADDAATIPVAKEDLYAALIAPAMADGRITVAEREVILTVAKRILTAEQIEELEKRIAWYERQESAPDV